MAGGISVLVGFAINFHAAIAGDDFHAFGFVGAEVVFAGINQAECFFGAVREENGVADDFGVKIEVGFRDGGDVFEFGGDWHK